MKAKSAQEPNEEKEPGKENEYPHTQSPEMTPKSRTRTTKKGLQMHLHRGSMSGGRGYQEEGDTGHEEYEEMEGGVEKGHFMSNEETTGETEQEIKVYYLTNIEIKDGRIYQYTTGENGEETTEEGNAEGSTEETASGESTEETASGESTEETASGESPEGTASEENTEETTSGESTEETATEESTTGGKTTKGKKTKGKTTTMKTTKGKTTEKHF